MENNLIPSIPESTYRDLKDSEGFVHIDFFDNPEEELYHPAVAGLASRIHKTIKESIFKKRVSVQVYMNPVTRKAKMTIKPVNTHTALNFVKAHNSLYEKFRSEIESSIASY